MPTGAIIPVAGLSSRMGAFKPLMTLNGFPLIRMTVQCALDAGVNVVCVVTGHEGRRVCRALEGVMTGEALASGSVARALGETLASGETRASGETLAAGEARASDSPTVCPPQKQRVICVENPDFATTDMLRSIKLGLQELLSYAEGERTSGSEAGRLTSAFILPGDVPAVHPKTLTHLLGQMAGERTNSPHVTPHALRLPFLIPTHEGRRGHPVLLARECFDAVLRYEGNDGLRGALVALDGEQVPVVDLGILLDADDPEAFEELSRCVRAHKGLSGELVDELLDACETLPHIREHCTAVSALAVRMARGLNALGWGLDTQLCRSAAALHDMLRLEPQHEKVAGQRLLDLGYDALAEIVCYHNTFVRPALGEFTEALIVCLADKLVKGTTLIAPSQRYAPGLQKFPETTEVGQRIRRDLATCQQTLERYETLTGDRIIARSAE